MSKHFSKKPLALAIGAAFTMAGGVAQASVFQTTDLAAGYMVAAAGDAKTAEKKCGEAKCGEAVFKSMDTNGDGSISKDEFMAAHKGAAEGKCGAEKGADTKMKKEGKCGEGKCGDKKK